MWILSFIKYVHSDCTFRYQRNDHWVRASLNFITAQTVDTVLDAALNREVEMIPAILQDIPKEMKNKKPKPGIRQ